MRVLADRGIFLWDDKMSREDKLCKKCGKSIQGRILINGVEKFAQNRKYCFECSPSRAGRYDKWSQARKNMSVGKALQIKLDRKRELIKLSGNQCLKCGLKYEGKYERIFCFHHKDPSKRMFGLSMNNLGKKWDVIMEEFAKCDMYCLNCHSMIHADEQETKISYRNMLGVK
jgi:hypothetical protein